MQQTLLDLAQHYGYIVILLGVGIESMGIPVPGETVLVIGAVLAARGQLNPVAVGVAGSVGAIVGDNTGYWVGRRWGSRLTRLPVIRRVYRPDHVARAERFFERHGVWAVFTGRFIALLRILAGPLAGMHHMPWRLFLVANAAGGILWVSVVVLVGFGIGNNLDTAAAWLTRSSWAGLALAVLVVAGFTVRHRLRQRHH